MKRYLVFTLLLGSCGKHQATNHEPPAPLPSVTVNVQAATLQDHAATEDVVGTVRSKQRAVVEAKVSGRVLEYSATPGTMVKAGDMLARLDVAEIQAKVDQAKAMLDQTSRDFERQRQLILNNATTRQEYDAAEARVKVAAADVTGAETMLSYAKVTAPFDGVVTRKLADVGDLAMPGKPLMEIEAPSALRFEADLPEALLDRVKLGDKLQVQLTKRVKGAVSEISPVADPVSRTFRVKLDLPGVEGLRTGQFGRVSVPVAETKILSIANKAVTKRGQMEIAFVARDGRATMRLIKTGRSLGDRLEVLSGIEEGDQIILSNNVADGQPITLAP